MPVALLSLAGLAQSVSNGEKGGSPISGLLTKVPDLLKGLFDKKSKPHKSDWDGWEAQDRARPSPVGTSAQNWILNDGDSARNEAMYIQSWIELYGIETVVNYSPWFKRHVTVYDLADKFRRGGYVAEADKLIAHVRDQERMASSSEYVSGNVKKDDAGVPANASKKNNTVIIIVVSAAAVVIGVVLYLTRKNSK